MIQYDEAAAITVGAISYMFQGRVLLISIDVVRGGHTIDIEAVCVRDPKLQDLFSRNFRFATQWHCLSKKRNDTNRDSLCL